MAKKLTPMQELFKHEQRRLRRAISRELRQTGVILDKSLIPEMPKRVTQKQLNKIKQITPSVLREQTDFIENETGKTVNYEQARDAWQTNQQILTPLKIDTRSNTISGYFRSIEHYNIPFQTKMKQWIGGLIQQYGKKKVAAMLDAGIRDGVLVTRQVVYSEAECIEYMGKMLSYLPMDSDTKASLLESAEQTEGYEEPE